MRGTLYSFLFSTLLAPAITLSQDHTLYISPLLSYDSFRTPGLENGIDFGVGAGLRFSSSIVLSASAALGYRSLTYDVIGGSQSVNARVFSVGGSLELLFLGRPGRARLAATFGGGWISSAFESQTISLGALGSIMLPGHTVSRGFIQTGLSGELPLSRDVAVVILPSVRLFTPISSTADFSIAGGLRVGIL